MSEPSSNAAGHAEGPPEVVPLAEMQAGRWGRLHATRLRPEDSQLLHAMGLTGSSDIRVCKTGEPCIVQVHATRLALSAALARRILITPA